MIRSLLDPVCWEKVRVLNIRKLDVRYGCVFAFEAVLIIIIYNLGWLEGCQCRGIYSFTNSYFLP